MPAVTGLAFLRCHSARQVSKGKERWTARRREMEWILQVMERALYTCRRGISPDGRAARQVSRDDETYQGTPASLGTAHCSLGLTGPDAKTPVSPSK